MKNEINIEYPMSPVLRSTTKDEKDEKEMVRVRL